MLDEGIVTVDVSVLLVEEEFPDKDVTICVLLSVAVIVFGDVYPFAADIPFVCVCTVPGVPVKVRDVAPEITAPPEVRLLMLS